MKTLIFLFCLYSVSCASSGFKVRSLASLKCTIKNYKDFIFQNNKQPPHCDLRLADLRGLDFSYANFSYANLRLADLRGAILNNAKFYGADLTGTKVTPAQAKILQAQGLSGFVIMSAKL